MTHAPPSGTKGLPLPTNPALRSKSSTPAGEVGVRFGRYRLFDKIGSGEMADIYRAVALGAQGFERIVAIKRIRPEAEIADISKLFADEARLSALLEHPNIVQVYDFGAVDGNHYIAMEYLRGKNLDQVLGSLRASGERLSPALAVLIAREVARGLAHAHGYCDEEGQRLDIVHRDVSPANIMLLHAGAVKLLDFGIARVTSKLRMAITASRTGSLRGKCQYLAPEQVIGDPVDARSDIFALGAVLWEMLTGHQLFGGASDFEVMSAVTNGTIPAPSTMVPGLPPALDRVVLTALARRPDQRYASADAMASDLESVMSTLPSRHGDLPALLGKVEAAGTPLPVATPSGNAFARICGELQARPVRSSVAGGFLAVLASVAICVLLIATLSPRPESPAPMESASHSVVSPSPRVVPDPVPPPAPAETAPAAVETPPPLPAPPLVPATAPAAGEVVKPRAARPHPRKPALNAAAARRPKSPTGQRLAGHAADKLIDPFAR
jgi:eukaryotic-like serine/threonine-protein kinase